MKPALPTDEAELQANLVMEELSARWAPFLFARADAINTHLYEMHKLRDERFYWDINRYCICHHMQTFGGVE